MAIVSCNTINRPPTVPKYPSPWDGATNQPLQLKLSWSCEELDGDTPMSFDVWLGKSQSNLYLISNKQYGKSKEISGLDYGTTYYWKVIPYDSKGKERKIGINIWKFTTKINNKPSAPSNPEPDNWSTEQPRYLTLSWLCSDPDGDKLTYKVYFGTNSNPPYKTTTSSRSYYTGLLMSNTTYYWRILAMDGHGKETLGILWRFKTGE